MQASSPMLEDLALQEAEDTRWHLLASVWGLVLKVGEQSGKSKIQESSYICNFVSFIQENQTELPLGLSHASRF